MPDLEYLHNSNLKVWEKELPKVVLGGVVGTTLWKIALKCAKITLFARIFVFLCVFIIALPSFCTCPEMASGGLQPPSPPKSTTVRTYMKTDCYRQEIYVYFIS